MTRLGGLNHQQRLRSRGRLGDDCPFCGELFGEDQAIDLEVVDHQDMGAAQGSPRPSSWPDRGAGFEVHLEPEGRTSVRMVGDRDLAAHQLDQFTADRKAQAGAAKAAGDRSVGLLELLKQPAFRLLCHAHAAIVHLDLDPGRAAWELLRSRLDRHEAAVGEFHRVGHQIREDLANAGGVTDELSPRARIHIGGDIQTLLERTRRQQLGHVFD